MIKPSINILAKSVPQMGGVCGEISFPSNKDLNMKNNLVDYG